MTDPWGADTEVVGPLTLHLTLASTAIDTHIIARVSDVSPKGTVHILSFGWLQAAHRKRDTQRSRADEIMQEHRVPEPLVPGTPVTLDFSLNPTANLFKRGHRLRLEVGSRPDLLKATVFDGFVFSPTSQPCIRRAIPFFWAGARPRSWN